MPKRSSTDVNQIAAPNVAVHTNGDNGAPKKNRAAVALGRLGGLKGGKARAASLTEERRREIAQRAARSRWAKRR